MGRRSSTGGVLPIGHRRIQFDFTIDSVRNRPTLPWLPNEPYRPSPRTMNSHTAWGRQAITPAVRAHSRRRRSPFSIDSPLARNFASHRDQSEKPVVIAWISNDPPTHAGCGLHDSL